MFRSMLDYKAERAGCSIVEVDARYTSQACSGCGKVEKKLLSQLLTKARSGPTELNAEVVNSNVLRPKADAL